MTEAELDALMALKAAGAQGKWEAVAAGQADDLNEVVALGGYKTIADAEGHDAALIAAAVNALPALVAAARERDTAHEAGRKAGLEQALQVATLYGMTKAGAAAIRAMMDAPTSPAPKPPGER